MFEDKVLLITGGTGSFGNAVLRRFLAEGIKEIRIFSRDEKKQDDMRSSLGSNRVKFLIGDVRDFSSTLDAFQGVDFIFHAAALKQVPSCEFHPMEAVKTNIIGTNNVINAAVSAGVSKLVVLSTDKAVYPINSMGITKAMAEKLVIAQSRTIPERGPVICATRYGNVMASRGSVIPLFIKQILHEDNLTITDPNMTRFLMSLDESVDLVKHAILNASPGDIFVQKAPASTVYDLAIALMQILERERDIRIIGTRHGEKLYESLVSREEMAKAVVTDKYFRIPADNRDLNYSKFFSEGEPQMSEYEDYTSHNTTRLSVEQIKSKLLELDEVRQHVNA
jgi:UDP-glucose 4-epimerase